MRTPSTVTAALGAALAVAVGGCAEGQGTAPRANDPDATPAFELTGAELREGDLQVLPAAESAGDIAGRAWLAEDSEGTTVTLKLTGLQAGKNYVSHVHQQRCASDGGGPHFAFDPDLAPVPPNEVHLRFTADEGGRAQATVTNSRRVGAGAKSIVVHRADGGDKLACADLLYVIGGGNSAGQAAIHLAETPRRVVMLIRGERPADSMPAYLLHRLRRTGNIELRPHHEVLGLDGDDQLTAITLRDRAGGVEERVDTNRSFALIGDQPNTAWAPTAPASSA